MVEPIGEAHSAPPDPLAGNAQDVIFCYWSEEGKARNDMDTHVWSESMNDEDVAVLVVEDVRRAVCQARSRCRSAGGGGAERVLVGDDAALTARTSQLRAADRCEQPRHTTGSLLRQQWIDCVDDALTASDRPPSARDVVRTIETQTSSNNTWHLSTHVIIITMTSRRTRHGT